MTSQPLINKCHHFKAIHDIKKLPRQIYSKLPEVPFKHFDSKKNVKEFYTPLFKDLSSMLFCLVSFACNFRGQHVGTNKISCLTFERPMV